MLTKEIEIKSPQGLHLRVAAQIVKETQNSSSKVTFFNENGQSADAASILDLLILAAEKNSVLKVTAAGEDEQKTIDKVSLILTDGAGI